MFKRKSSDAEATFEVSKSEEEWRAQLPADRYAVLRRAGTEPAWSGDLLHVDGHGVFRCAGCGAELFDTDAKFESGTGWPYCVNSLSLTYEAEGEPGPEPAAADQHR